MIRILRKNTYFVLIFLDILENSQNIRRKSQKMRTIDGIIDRFLDGKPLFLVVRYPADILYVIIQRFAVFLKSGIVSRIDVYHRSRPLEVLRDFSRLIFLVFVAYIIFPDKSVGEAQPESVRLVPCPVVEHDEAWLGNLDEL